MRVIEVSRSWQGEGPHVGEEAEAYPDNEIEFIRLFNKAMPCALGPNKHVELIMPVGHLVKHEIVKLGLEVGAPLPDLELLRQWAQVLRALWTILHQRPGGVRVAARGRGGVLEGHEALRHPKATEGK